MKTFYIAFFALVQSNKPIFRAIQEADVEKVKGKYREKWIWNGFHDGAKIVFDWINYSVGLNKRQHVMLDFFWVIRKSVELVKDLELRKVWFLTVKFNEQYVPSRNFWRANLILCRSQKC